MVSPVINTAAGAFVVGLLTSLHCAAMCGPLLCAALPKPSAGYHGGRLIAYTSLGAAAGALGEAPLQKLMKSPLLVLPWMLVVLLAGILIGWKPRLPKPRFLTRLSSRISLQQQGRAKGFLLGLMTPLLPCGPLYLVLAACLVSGSAVMGAQFAFAFTLGTMPLLWVSQAGWGRLSLRLAPQRFKVIQRVVAAVALGMVLWRLNTLRQTEPEGKCPLCAGAGTTP